MSRRLAILMMALAGTLAGGVIDANAQRPETTLPANVGDLGTVQLVEIRDGQGQVLLHGTFSTTANSAKETERAAELISPTGQKAKGRAEIEIERKEGVVSKDEIEISVEHLPAMTTCSLLVDGQTVTSFTTTKKGKAELELGRKAGVSR